MNPCEKDMHLKETACFTLIFCLYFKYPGVDLHCLLIPSTSFLLAVLLTVSTGPDFRMREVNTNYELILIISG